MHLVTEEQARSVIDDKLLGLMVQRFALLHVRDPHRLLEQIVDLGIYIEGDITGAHALPTKECGEEIVGVTVVALPTA